MKPSSRSTWAAWVPRTQNFHKQVFDRMGYEAISGRGAASSSSPATAKDQATALIPDELVDDMHIVGTAAEVKERAVQAWEATGVTTLLLSCGSGDEVRRIAELLA